MVFTAHNMRNAKVAVINYGRQMIQKCSVFSDNNRVAQVFSLIFYGSAHNVIPGNFAGN